MDDTDLIDMGSSQPVIDQYAVRGREQQLGLTSGNDGTCELRIVASWRKSARYSQRPLFWVDRPEDAM